MATYNVTAVTYMSQVTYSCRPGYVMAAGDEVRTCEENGRWSGAAPTCESEWKETVCVRRQKRNQRINNVHSLYRLTIGPGCLYIGYV